jgi:hypothetical protein
MTRRLVVNVLGKENVVFDMFALSVGSSERQQLDAHSLHANVGGFFPACLFNLGIFVRRSSVVSALSNDYHGESSCCLTLQLVETMTCWLRFVSLADKS